MSWKRLAILACDLHDRAGANVASSGCAATRSTKFRSSPTYAQALRRACPAKQQRHSTREDPGARR